MAQQNLIVSALKWDKFTFENELSRLQDIYYNAGLEEQKQIISDATYDELVKIYESKYGPYTRVGAIPREEKKDVLPFFLSSLDKMKTVKDIELFLKKFPGIQLVITGKIDGISSLSGPAKLDTRGNGRLGTNITRSKKTMKIPESKVGEYERGEIAIQKDIFEKKYLGQGYESSRNMIFGVLNSKDSYDPQIVADLDFLAYRYEDGTIRTQLDQFKILEQKGFKTP